MSTLTKVENMLQRKLILSTYIVGTFELQYAFFTVVSNHVEVEKFAADNCRVDRRIAEG